MRRLGVTIIEFMIAMAIMLVVLGTLATYFGGVIGLNRSTQARNEVEDKVKLVMQVVTQDLQMTGSNQFVSGGVPYTVVLSSPVISGTNSTAQDSLSLTYATSLRSSQTASCRSVAYTFSTNTLNRSDVQCGSAVDAQPFVDNILSLDIQYICSDGSTSNTPSCPTNTFVRSARVSVVGRSENYAQGNPVASFSTVTGQTISCAVNYICFGLNQEVVMPNLKDK